MTPLKFLYNFLIITLFTAGALTCNTTDPPVDKAELLLTLEDVSSTEAWITLTTNNLQFPAIITIKQNDQNRLTLNLDKTDTLLYIDSLLPNQNYNFQAFLLEKQVTSNKLSVTTLDTTSQNFSFEIFEFGDGFESSYFNDVWIFDENNIWSVGYISSSDTIVNGTPIINPNIIRWNGISWALEPFDGTSSGIDGIWAVDSSLIYFAFGNVLKYQSGVYEHIIVPGNWQTGQSIEKLWGSSESNIYGVGPWGTIVWYNGSQWTKVEFDMQWSFYGITGNKETGVAYAVGRNTNFSTIIVELNGNSTTVIFDNRNYYPFNNSFSGLWLKDRLYLAERRIWTLVPGIIKPNDLYLLPFGTGIYVITGTEKNNIFFFGSSATMVHFNGVKFQLFDLGINSDIYGGGHASTDIAARVGFANNKAFITIIRRK
jgi:hypothetical protein